MSDPKQNDPKQGGAAKASPKAGPDQAHPLPAGANHPKLTTLYGAPVPNNQDSLTAGPRGPMLLQDAWFL